MSDDDTPKRHVSEEVRQATKSCCYNFKCLTDDKYPLCPAQYTSTEDRLFVVPKVPLRCPYLLHFVYRTLCRCPTRREIHRLNLAENA